MVLPDSTFSLRSGRDAASCVGTRCVSPAVCWVSSSLNFLYYPLSAPHSAYNWNSFSRVHRDFSPRPTSTGTFKFPFRWNCTGTVTRLVHAGEHNRPPQLLTTGASTYATANGTVRLLAESAWNKAADNFDGELRVCFPRLLPTGSTYTSRKLCQGHLVTYLAWASKRPLLAPNLCNESGSQWEQALRKMHKVENRAPAYSGFFVMYSLTARKKGTERSLISQHCWPSNKT